MLVKATREGLAGNRTATGWRVNNAVAFVALPHKDALYKIVKVTNPLNKKSINAVVLDIGPWNIDDSDYVFGKSGKQARPQSETGTDKFGRTSNKAGIDLGEKVWNALEMKDNTEVEWEFI